MNKIKSKAKQYQDELFKQSKKGSTYITKEGKVKKRSDFKRGEALGAAKAIKRARYLYKLQKEKETKKK